MEIITSKPLKPVWLKASVIGSTWAAIEVILGSFLHNLKIPLAGTILSFISVWLLISFLQIWKENGLALRAGIICAILKSVSPSAIILGPMIGIFSEALVIELAIFIFGKNIIGFMFGGALAVLSSLLHKVVSLLILYGFNLVKILSDLYDYSVKQIGFEKVSPVFLLLIITAIYSAAGMVGAILGYIAGHRYLRTKARSVSQDEIRLQPGNKVVSESVPERYSVIFLFVHLFSIVITLYLINSSYTIPSVIASVIYVSFCIFKYKNSLFRLKKIYFWISFLVITFVAAFLWNGFSQGAFFSMNGLIIGLKMNERAIIIVIGFAAISVELKNPIIKSLLYSRGLANLYQSTNLAFSALPFFIGNISKPAEGGKKLSSVTFNNILNLAEKLLAVLLNEHHKEPGIVIITGEIHGKTTLVRQIVNELLSSNFRIGGFLSTAVFKEGQRTGYELFDIETSESTTLCSTIPDINRFKQGEYYFSDSGLLKGENILKADNLTDKQLIIIDEVGPLELGNKGWSNTIDNLWQSNAPFQLWVVRRNIINEVLKKWNISNVHIFDIEKDTIEDILNELKLLLSAAPAKS